MGFGVSEITTNSQKFSGGEKPYFDEVSNVERKHLLLSNCVWQCGRKAWRDRHLGYERFDEVLVNGFTLIF